MSKPKAQRWWPGMYERKTPQQVHSEIGTAVPAFPEGQHTPPSMRALDLKTARLGGNGKICKPLNGGTL